MATSLPHVKENVMLFLTYIGYFLIGGIEWVIALGRTLALVKKKRVLLITLVLFENMLGLLVLSRFITNNDWIIAIVYSTGGALGSLIATYFNND